MLTGFKGGRGICVEQAYEKAVACSASSKSGLDAGIWPWCSTISVGLYVFTILTFVDYMQV